MFCLGKKVVLKYCCLAAESDYKQALYTVVVEDGEDCCGG